MEYITTSERQTFNLAIDFAKQLNGGEVIGLVGDLGAGKTVFTQGLAAGLGVRQNITSPTFVLMKVYNIKGGTEIRKFCHIDAYRINTAHDLTAIGAEGYFYAPDTVTIIEWADKAYPELFSEKRGVKIKSPNPPKKTTLITIREEKNKRLIEVKSY